MEEIKNASEGEQIPLSISGFQYLDIKGVESICLSSKSPSEITIYLVTAQNFDVNAAMSEFINKTDCFNLFGVKIEVLFVRPILNRMVVF